MVGPDEVDDTLQVEVEDECSKYGQVEQVIIYQEKRSESEYVPAVVKIFVKYSMPQGKCNFCNLFVESVPAYALVKVSFFRS